MKINRQPVAADAIAQLELSESNAALAEYWLSLWSRGRPPTRAAFNPMRVPKHLAGIALFEITHAGPIGCRLAGTAIESGLGFRLTGKDFLSLLPAEEVPIRRLRLRHLVCGSVAVARTSYVTGDGREGVQENLMLPFGGVSESGSQQFLLHTNVRPSSEDLVHRPDEWNTGLPQEYVTAGFF